MPGPEAMRDAVAEAFVDRRALAWVVWLAVPLWCLAWPGPGVLVAAGWILLFLWLGRQGPRTVGLSRPERWSSLTGAAFGLAGVIWCLDVFAFTPLLELLLDARKDLSGLRGIEGNWPMFFAWLALGWVVGGVLEELVFRGFLIQFGARLLGERSIWYIAVLGSVVFGLSHQYQGVVGVVSTGIIAFLFAAIFILSKRNLLLVVLVHGFVNTISLTLLFLGVGELA